MIERISKKKQILSKLDALQKFILEKRKWNINDKDIGAQTNILKYML